MPTHGLCTQTTQRHRTPVLGVNITTSACFIQVLFFASSLNQVPHTDHDKFFTYDVSFQMHVKWFNGLTYIHGWDYTWYSMSVFAGCAWVKSQVGYTSENTMQTLPNLCRQPNNSWFRTATYYLERAQNKVTDLKNLLCSMTIKWNNIKQLYKPKSNPVALSGTSPILLKHRWKCTLDSVNQTSTK